MRRVILATVGTIVGLIMLLSFKTHAGTTTLASEAVLIAGPSTSTTPSTAPSSSPTTPTTAPAPTTSTTLQTATVTGIAAPTRYGPVQVQVTVTNGQITAVQAVEYPTASGRDRQINGRAIPLLNQEVLDAQSASIHTISGATYTYNGYVTSLQSALDKAGVS